MVQRLRFKMLQLFLPLLLLTVTVSGTLAFLEYQAALLQSVNRHLSYKVEQLRDFLFSEWSVIEDLGLEAQEAYREAFERSFRSYAFSLLRDETERVLTLDGGRVSSIIGLKAITTPSEPMAGVEVPEAGWFTTTLEGQVVVGVSFAFTPFQRTVALTQVRSVFFAGIENILVVHLWILLFSVVIASLMTTIYVNRVVRPVEDLSDTLNDITRMDDLSLRVVVESADEIGQLSHNFNLMIATLEDRVRQLVVSEQAERTAKETTAKREQETLLLLGKISDFRDEKTGEHLTRIGAMSGLLARLAGFDEETQTLIRLAAPLHDLGKVAIPDSILLKPGRLTPEETAFMRHHTVAGHEILKASESVYLIEGATIALSHHEKWDGTGYPRGLQGEAIPQSARIVAIVDVFDALVSERPYKRAWTNEEALSEMTGQSGRHFDPQLLALFLNHFSDFCHLREQVDQEIFLGAFR